MTPKINPTIVFMAIALVLLSESWILMVHYYKADAVFKPTQMPAQTGQIPIAFNPSGLENMGVVVQKPTRALCQSFGVRRSGGGLITEVIQGSAAENAGLMPGDIINQLNGI